MGRGENRVGSKFFIFLIMKKVLMFFAFSLCFCVFAIAGNDKPTTNGETKPEQVTSATSAQVKLAKVTVRESVVANVNNLNAVADEESGKKKHANKDGCKNGKGNCAPPKKSSDDEPTDSDDMD